MIAQLSRMSIKRIGLGFKPMVRPALFNPIFSHYKHTTSPQLASSQPAKPQITDPFLAGSGGSYIETMYTSWLTDPNSVHLSWRYYFSNLNSGLGYQPPPTLVTGSFNPNSLMAHIIHDPNSDIKVKQLKVELMGEAYRDLGHYQAKLDPLGLKVNDQKVLSLDQFGLSNEDLELEFELGKDLLPGFLDKGISSLQLKDILGHLERIYCTSTGYEFNHIKDQARLDWLKQKIESQTNKLELDGKKLALNRLAEADSFERTFATKFTTVKRYGLEGADSMMPGLLALVDRASEVGIKDVVIGMPHRGRLNVFTNLMGQKHENVFAEFSGKATAPHPLSGDSSYHLAVEHTHKTGEGKEVKLSLTANPSHLEAVNPVAMGTTRAKQQIGVNKIDIDSTMTLLLHGDAAIAGQGVVYETNGFHTLPSFTTGGTVHMVVNNQIGFTTNPHISRSTQYCCDIAKLINAPILHVNGDDVEAVISACELAVEFRQKFKQDIFIDLICFRKNGHNEVDQPSYTQPKMYQTISKHPDLLSKYSNQLVKEGSFKKEEVDEVRSKAMDKMDQAYQKSKNLFPINPRWDSKRFPSIMSPKDVFTKPIPTKPTGAKLDHLKVVAETFSAYPESFNVHKNLSKVLQARNALAVEGQHIDWPTAELLAFGTLLLEGTQVRISGQDVERGTFSQRHAVIVDQSTEARHTPLNHLSPTQAPFYPCNSSLSEFGVMGFEFGYTLNDPNALVIWEAQFGDFSNVAQCMIDQFVASSEQKWLQPTGLTLLLPHGFDGNGPEHSSGRMERYLQLTDEHPNYLPENKEMKHQLVNWSIISPTTPSNYFHALRRQIKRDFRKPLISFNGKNLLRHPMARTTMDQLASDSLGFQSTYPEAFPETLVSNEKVRTHILCTGQVYYRLIKAREQNNIDDVAISRIEELAPFPFHQVNQLVRQYPNAELVWCQEEPVNMGAYSHVLPRIQTSLQDQVRIRYAGRGPSAAVAVGNKLRHYDEDYSLISQALYGKEMKVASITNGTPNFE